MIHDWLVQHPEYAPEIKKVAAKIWRLQHLPTGKPHRIKFAFDVKSTYFLHQEARWLSRLGDERFGCSHALRQWQKHHYLITDFLPGIPLSTAIRDGWFCSPQRITDTVAQCIDLIEFVHQRGIVHGDIKPNNFLLDEDGRVALIDFANAGWVGRSLQARPYRGFSAHYSHPRLAVSEGVYEVEFDWFGLLRVMAGVCGVGMDNFDRAFGLTAVLSHSFSHSKS